jgi:hypothetical protein
MAIAFAEKKKTKTGDPQMIQPRKDERFRCQKCGMEIEIITDCKSTGGHHARFECCGQPLTRE